MRSWVDGAVAVVAIHEGGRCSEVSGHDVAEARARRNGVGVVVRVGVEVEHTGVAGAGVSVVGEQVAIFVGVEGVADFLCPWVDGAVAVVAINEGGRRREVARHDVAEARGRRDGVGVAISVGVEVELARVAGAGVSVVGERVAIFVGVGRVADFGRAWIDR